MAPAYPTTAAPAPTGSPTGLVNLNDYLALNRAQGTRMANNMADGIEGEGKALQGDIAKAGSDFASATDAATYRFDPNLVGATGYSGSRPDDTSDLAVANKLRGQRKYEGPEGLAGAEDFRNRARATSEKANGIAKFSERGAMLRDTAGKQGSYSQGQQEGDSFLMGAAAGDRFAQLQALYGQLGQGVDAAETTAKGLRDDAIKTSDDAAAQYTAAGDAYSVEAQNLQRLRAAEDRERRKVKTRSSEGRW